MTTAKPAAPVARDADAELEALFAAIDDVILVLDAEGRYVKIAPTNPSLLYRPAAGLLGKTLREVFDPTQAEQFMEYIRTALATQTTVHFEYSLPIAGREVWFSGAISPMSRDQVVLVGRDITDRKRAAERLRASEQRFRALVEHSSDVITLLAPDGTVIYASPSTQPVLGYGATENVGRSAFAVVGVDELEGAPSHVLGRAVAQHRLRGWAGVDHRSVRCEQRDDVARVLDQRAEPLLARAQPLGRPLAIGDVPAHQHHLIAAHGRDRPGKPHLAARDWQTVLKVDRRPGRERGADVLHELLRLGGVEHFPQRLAEQFGGRAIQQRWIGGSDLDVATLGVEHEDDVVDRREQRLELGIGVAGHGCCGLCGGHSPGHQYSPGDHPGATPSATGVTGVTPRGLARSVSRGRCRAHWSRTSRTLRAMASGVNGFCT